MSPHNGDIFLIINEVLWKNEFLFIAPLFNISVLIV
jgi:hypothetical protein